MPTSCAPLCRQAVRNAPRSCVSRVGGTVRALGRFVAHPCAARLFATRRGGARTESWTRFACQCVFVRTLLLACWAAFARALPPRGRSQHAALVSQLGRGDSSRAEPLRVHTPGPLGRSQCSALVERRCRVNGSRSKRCVCELLCRGGFRNTSSCVSAESRTLPARSNMLALAALSGGTTGTSLGCVRNAPRWCARRRASGFFAPRHVGARAKSKT